MYKCVICTPVEREDCVFRKDFLGCFIENLPCFLTDKSIFRGEIS